MKKKIVKNYEVEEAIAHLYFYTKISTIVYKEYKDTFNKILTIIEKWIGNYAKDENLNFVTEEEAKELIDLRDSVPFEIYVDYTVTYYEEVENFIDIILYYASIPINEYYDESTIKVKGNKKE
jgi:hypothetical protein